MEELAYLLGLVSLASNRIVPTKILISIVKGLESFFISVIVLKKIVDLLADRGSIESILHWVLLGAIVRSIIILLTSYADNIVFPAESVRVKGYFANLCNRRAVSIDLAGYDDPVFYEQLAFAIKELSDRVERIINDIATLISTILTIVLTSSFAFSIDPYLALIVVIPIIGDSIVRVRMGKAESEKIVEIGRHMLKYNYANDTLTSARHAKEVRLTNIKSVLEQMFEDASEKANSCHQSFSKPLTRLYLISDFLSEPKNILITVYLAYSTIVTKRISPGEFIAAQAALMALSSNLGKISERIMVFAHHNVLIRKFRTFMNYKNVILGGDSVLENINKIELKDVYFRYDKESDYILRGVSFIVVGGESLAIVGENGEGKTTILKLLTRFYDPERGQILINDNPIQSYTIESLRSQFQAVLQSYNCYKTTVRQNISAGANIGDCDLRRALWQVNLQYALALDMPIGKDFDENGLELSVGQKQRLAIARALLKGGSVLLLDEPSAALDPLAEVQVSRMINEISGGKISVIVSHRLSFTKNSSCICVLKEGAIVEMGNHHDLMAMGGKYCTMYNAQQATTLV